MIRPVFSEGRCAPIADTLSPAMPTSPAYMSVAVTMIPFRISVSKRMPSPPVCCSDHPLRSGLATRDNVAAIGIQGLLFVAAHQIDVELRHAGAAQRLEFREVRLHRPQQAKAVHDFVGDKRGVVAAHFAMM